MLLSKSLIAKIVGAVGLIIFILVGILGSFTFANFYRNTQDNIRQALRSTVEKEANFIHADIFAKVEVVTENYAGLINGYDTYDVAFLGKASMVFVESLKVIVGGGYWLEYHTVKDKKYYGPYWYKDGGAVKLTWDYSTEANDYTKYDWYINDGLKDQRKVVWSEPYDDAVTKVPMITATGALGKDGRKRGVVTIDVGLKELADYVSSIKVPGLAQYSFSLLTKTGICLASRDKTVVGKKIADTENITFRPAGNPAEGTVMYQSPGSAGDSRRKLVTITPIASTGLLLALTVDDGTVFAAVNSALLFNIAITVAALLAAIAILSFFIQRIVIAPVKSAMVLFRQIGQGDLTCALDAKLGARRDEIGGLAASVMEMQSRLHALTLAVRTNALGVQAGAREIVGSVDEQAASTNQMSAAVAEITSTMEELSASSTQIAEYSRAVVDIANQTWENSKKGSQAMVELQGKIEGIQADNEVSLQEIMDLGRKSKEISKVMAIINVVADQTKLIAFNAALEASSAGEAGKRFGVVAAEIRRLADSVTDSTGEIEARINEIQDSISRLVITSEKGSLGIAAGMRASTLTSGLLGALVDAASQTTSAAQQISLSTQQQKTASNQVVIALREIVSSSQHTVDSIKRIAAVSHGMTASAAELNELVGRFKLGGQA